MIEDARYLSVSEKAALTQIKERVSAMFPVHQYILFGSKARGDFEADSDVDLLIVTGRKLAQAEKHEISHVLFGANMRHDTLFSMIAVARDEWEGALWRVLPLHEDVMSHGVAV